MVTTNNIEQQDILEVLEKRYRVHSTILCSQFGVAGWHSKLGGGALADAILDRIVSKSQTIKIKGDRQVNEKQIKICPGWYYTVRIFRWSGASE